MKQHSALNWLVPLIGLLALATASAGLLLQDGRSPYSFTTLHGQTTQIAGQGLYRYDSLFTAAAFRGTDAVTILVALPLFVVSFLNYRRGKLRGTFLLTGALSYFLYNGASMSFAAAYNELFLVYVTIFSASLFAFVLALASIDIKSLPFRISARLPHGRIAVFLFVAGLVVLFLWGSEIVGALLEGQAPELLGIYTTTVTHAINMGVIAPAAILAGILLLQRNPYSYVFAFPLLTLNSLIGIVVMGQTVSQIHAGIVFSTGQLIGIVGSWLILAGFAIWMAVLLYRNISDTKLMQA